MKSVTIYTPSLMKIGSAIQMFGRREYTDSVELP
jgi:hypothetical protein